MAQRFGGKYSPNGNAQVTPQSTSGTFRGARRSRVGMRVNLLFLAPLPLIFRAFGSGPAELAMNLGGLGLLLLAAWMTREGLFAQEAYEARKIARRPGFPRKIAGGVLTGLGLALVKRFVEEANGRIQCQSDESGTTFCISLPIAVTVGS